MWEKAPRRHWYEYLQCTNLFLPFLYFRLPVFSLSTNYKHKKTADTFKSNGYPSLPPVGKQQIDPPHPSPSAAHSIITHKETIIPAWALQPDLSPILLRPSQNSIPKRPSSLVPHSPARYRQSRRPPGSPHSHPTVLSSCPLKPLGLLLTLPLTTSLVPSSTSSYDPSAGLSRFLSSSI